MINDYKTIGEKLVYLRGSRTQNEVARELGISISALSMYETNRRVPRDEIKVRISRYYDVNICDLFYFG